MISGGSRKKEHHVFHGVSAPKEGCVESLQILAGGSEAQRKTVSKTSPQGIATVPLPPPASAESTT